MDSEWGGRGRPDFFAPVRSRVVATSGCSLPPFAPRLCPPCASLVPPSCLPCAGGTGLGRGVNMRSRLVPAVIISALVVFAGVGALFAWNSHPWVFSPSQTLPVATIPGNGVGKKPLSALKQET